MKRLIVFLFVLFVSTAFIYSGEITLGFSWRTSDSGLVLGEHPLPFSWTTTRENYKPEWDQYFKRIDSREYVLSESFNSFLRRAYVVFGADFFLYKKQVSLGFELNAGYIERKYNVLITGNMHIVAPGYEYKDEWQDLYKDNKTRIIPINLFLNLKYKFDCVKKSVAWLRPYVGIGGGVSATIIIGEIQGICESGTYRDESEITCYNEKNFVYSKTFLTLVGVDLFFSKSVGIFIEGRYTKLLDKGKNFRDQVTVGVGFRFI